MIAIEVVYWTIVDVQTTENMKYSQEREPHTTIYYRETGGSRNINKYFQPQLLPHNLHLFLIVIK